jgi:hypothetical protein
MLAQSFLSAADLGISDIQHQSLVTVLGMLERGELVHAKYPIAKMFRGPNEFNMAATLDESTDCGSIGCICGWAHLVSGRKAFAEFFDEKPGSLEEMPVSLRRLFRFGGAWGSLCAIQPEQAATALRSYLTTGDAKWHEAVA